MAHRIVWSARAIADVERIAEYIALNSPRYAVTVVREIVERTRSLQQFPRLGRAVPEFADSDHRELRVYSYRVIYRIDDSNNEVLIAAVIHGKQDLGPWQA